MKTLIVYYSLYGSTEAAAKGLAEKLGADLRRIDDIEKRKGLIGFLVCGFEAKKGFESELKPLDMSLAVYDSVILATPLWAGSCAPAVNTFIRDADFSGKKVYALITSATSPAVKASESIRKKLRAHGTELTGYIHVRTAFQKPAAVMAAAAAQAGVIR